MIYVDKMDTTEADQLLKAAQRKPSLRCSCCLKSQREVWKLIGWKSSDGEMLCICDECISICNEILAGCTQ